MTLELPTITIYVLFASSVRASKAIVTTASWAGSVANNGGIPLKLEYLDRSW